MYKKLTYDPIKVLELYKQGKNDKEIAKILNCNDFVIYVFRRKNNLSSNFKYERNKKLEKRRDEILLLKSQNKGYRKISKELGIPRSSLKDFLDNNNIPLAIKTEIKNSNLDFFQRSMIIGTILGDGHLSKVKSPTLMFGHCFKQREYIDHKLEILKDLDFWRKDYQILNKKTGNTHGQIKAMSRANKVLCELYPLFYKDTIKIISNKMLEQFNEISLAYLFMDDGSGSPYNLQIATCGFDKESITNFRIFLLKKWEIETTVLSSNVVRIRQKSSQKFASLIKPYIIPSMEYKLKYVKSNCSL